MGMNITYTLSIFPDEVTQYTDQRMSQFQFSYQPGGAASQFMVQVRWTLRFRTLLNVFLPKKLPSTLTITAPWFEGGLIFYLRPLETRMNTTLERQGSARGLKRCATLSQLRWNKKMRRKRFTQIKSGGHFAEAPRWWCTLRPWDGGGQGRQLRRDTDLLLHRWGWSRWSGRCAM